MLRSVVPVFLLLASISAPASAMDPSAMEETNCLMACDANQENCGAGQVSPNKSHSLAASPSQQETKMSPKPAARPLNVIASGAKQSIAPHADRWIASSLRSSQ
jgi:hypothetical protein